MTKYTLPGDLPGRVCPSCGAGSAYQNEVLDAAGELISLVCANCQTLYQPPARTRPYSYTEIRQEWSLGVDPAAEAGDESLVSVFVRDAVVPDQFNLLLSQKVADTLDDMFMQELGPSPLEKATEAKWLLDLISRAYGLSAEDLDNDG